MPASTPRQQRWAGAIVGGAAPLPKGMSMAQAHDFARKPKHYAEGGVVGTPPPMPRYAEGGQVGVNPMAKRIYEWSRDYALSQGANGAAAEMFGRSMVAVAYSEVTSFDPNIVNSAGAVGLFQNIPVRGRGGNYTVQQLKDPKLSTDLAVQEMWPIFKSEGGGPAYNDNPLKMVQALSLKGQRPGPEAVAAATRDGRFTTGIQIGAQASGGSTAAPSGASAAATQSAAPPMPSAARAPVFAADMPKGEGGWTLPAAGSITSRFGSPFGMDSAGTYQGRTYAHFNKGVDIGGATIGGSPVRAMVAGVVKLAADDKAGWGPRVVVTDAEGFDHSYGHLANLAVTQGQKVTAGQQLAIVAPTAVGTSSGPHLSYDVTKNGELVDPTPWLTGGRAGSTAVDPAITHDPAKALRPTYLSDATATAPASTPTTPAGAAAPRGGAAVTTQTATGPSPEQTRAAARQKAYDDAVKEYNDLSSRPRASLTEGERNRVDSLPEILPILQRDADDAQKDAIASARLNPQGLSPDQAAASELGWAQLAETRRSNDREIVSTLLANDQVAQRLALDIIEHNDLNQERQVASALRKGELTSADATAILTARHNQQVDQLMWAAQGMERAKWIDEVNFRNAERILPPGTRYQRDFEPPSTLNKALELWGLPPIVVETTQVPRESLDPMANLARGRQSLEQAGVTRPDYGPDIQRLETQYAENRALPTFQAPAGGAQPPAGTEAGDWQSQLSALLSGNQPPTDIAAAGAAAANEAASTNPTQAPMSEGQDSDAFNRDSAVVVPLPTPAGASPGVAFEAGSGTGNAPPPTPPNRVGGQEAPRQNPEVGRGGPAPGPLPRPVQRQPAATPAPVIGPQRGPQPGPAPTPASAAARGGYYDSNTGEYVFANGMRMRVA